MTQYQVKYQERLEYAMSNLVIYRDFGMYAVVPSTSQFAVSYIVDINPETLYSENCDCEAGAHNQDCIHRYSTDRALDAERWNRTHGFTDDGLNYREEREEEEQETPAPTQEDIETYAQRTYEEMVTVPGLLPNEEETVPVETVMQAAQSAMEQFTKEAR